LRRVFRLTLALRVRLLAVGIPSMVGVALIYWAAGSVSERTVLTTVILAAGLVPAAVNQAYAAVYGGWERIDRRALVVVGTSGLTAGLGLALLAAGLGVLGIALAGLISSLVTLPALARPVGFNLLGGAQTPRWRELRPLAVAALPLMLSSLLATAFIQIDVLILQPLQGTTVVGHYNAAYKFINALNVLPASIVLAAFPLMARTAGDAEALVAWFTRTWRVLATLAGLAVVFLFMFSQDLIETLLGPAYLPTSATALAILIWFLPLSFLNGTLQYVLISQDRQWWLTPAFLATTLFNVGLNLALVPQYGFQAAAATTIASEVVLLAALAWLLRRDRVLRHVLEPAVRPLAGALAFAAVAWALREAPWIAAGATGVAAYLLVLLLTGGLSPTALRTAGAALIQRARAD
jgi:O-antigen/teichoic acid export membrane protein